MPEGDDDDLAEMFASYFIEKIEKIRSDLDSYKKFSVNTKHKDSNLNEFKMMTETEVRKIVMNSKSTTCLSDPIPTNLIKDNIDILLPLITKIVNLSLSIGEFAMEWKTAFILPLLKKVGLELIKNHYRPVSNLSFLSKTCKKSALPQTTKYSIE